MVSSLDIQILVALATYYTLTRVQITKLLLPGDTDGRATRRHLQKLLNASLLSRTRMEVVNPAMGAPAPVYYPSRAGCVLLAEHFQDERYLVATTQTPNWQNLYHWCAVAETHILFDKAAAKTQVVIEKWLGEWSIANPEESDPSRRYSLYTRLSDKLVCVPDAGFVVVGRTGARRAFYLEQDRHTTWDEARVAAQKCGGYAGLMEQRLAGGEGHLRHFPNSSPDRFTVLMVTPSPRRRDAIRKAVAPKPASQLWRFASRTELTEDTLLTSPVWYPCNGEPAAILKT